MLGPIRKILGPSKGHAKRLIAKEAKKLSTNPNLTKDEKLRDISVTHICIRHDIDKLQNTVDRLMSRDGDWCSLMNSASLSPEEKAEEEKLYSEAI